MDLGHALLKVTSQHWHFQTLIAFANSPRLQQALQCQLSLVLVPPPSKCVVKLPENVQQWRQVIDEICGEYYKFGATWPDKEAANLHEEYSKPDKLQVPCQSPKQSRSRFRLRSHTGLHAECSSQSAAKSQLPPPMPSWTNMNVHCECALIEFLANQHKDRQKLTASPVKGRENKDLKEEWQEVNRGKSKTLRRKGKGVSTEGKGKRSEVAALDCTWGGVPVFSYIGVSKLSCTPCQLWIQGYNALPGPSLYTRGNHGKWYRGWLMPELHKSQLSVHLVEQMSLAYLKYCRSKLRLKNLSDGRTAGMHDAPTSPDPEAEGYLEQLLSANP